MIWYKVALYDPRAYVVGVVSQKPCTAYIGEPHSVSPTEAGSFAHHATLSLFGRELPGGSAAGAGRQPTVSALLPGRCAGRGPAPAPRPVPVWPRKHGEFVGAIVKSRRTVARAFGRTCGRGAPYAHGARGFAAPAAAGARGGVPRGLGPRGNCPTRAGGPRCAQALWARWLAAAVGSLTGPFAPARVEGVPPVTAEPGRGRGARKYLYICTSLQSRCGV